MLHTIHDTLETDEKYDPENPMCTGSAPICPDLLPTEPPTEPPTTTMMTTTSTTMSSTTTGNIQSDGGSVPNSVSNLYSVKDQLIVFTFYTCFSCLFTMKLCISAVYLHFDLTYQLFI